MTSQRGPVLNTKAEWRTVAVIVAVYAGTIAVVGNHERLGLQSRLFLHLVDAARGGARGDLDGDDL